MKPNKLNNYPATTKLKATHTARMRNDQHATHNEKLHRFDKLPITVDIISL